LAFEAALGFAGFFAVSAGSSSSVAFFFDVFENLPCDGFAGPFFFLLAASDSEVPSSSSAILSNPPIESENSPISEPTGASAVVSMSNSTRLT
jgi:hypothetical protein